MWEKNATNYGDETLQRTCETAIDTCMWAQRSVKKSFFFFSLCRLVVDWLVHWRVPIFDSIRWIRMARNEFCVTQMAIWSERQPIRRENISSWQSLQTRFDKWHEKTCRSHDEPHSLSHAYGKLSSGKYYECDAFRFDLCGITTSHHIHFHPCGCMNFALYPTFALSPSGRILVLSTFLAHILS